MVWKRNSPFSKHTNGEELPTGRVWVSSLVYSFLALTVSPTEAWQKNSSMGDRSDMVGKTTADEEVCSKVKSDSN